MLVCQVIFPTHPIQLPPTPGPLLVIDTCHISLPFLNYFSGTLLYKSGRFVVILCTWQFRCFAPDTLVVCTRHFSWTGSLLPSTLSPPPLGVSLFNVLLIQAPSLFGLCISKSTTWDPGSFGVWLSSAPPPPMQRGPPFYLPTFGAPLGWACQVPGPNIWDHRLPVVPALGGLPSHYNHTPTKKPHLPSNLPHWSSYCLFSSLPPKRPSIRRGKRGGNHPL